MSWLEIARVLKEHSAPITSLDFSKDGELLLSAGEDTKLCLYSTTQGTLQRQAVCGPQGASLARFTHDPLSVVVASPADHAVRYMSLHDNRYLRSFRAHSAPITALEMSPKEDFFTTAAMDETARIWDLRTTNCQGVMRFAGGGHRPTTAFDPHGLVFAAAVAGSQVKLFDVRAYDKGPFCTFAPDLSGPKDFSGIKFSGDGKLMLLSTTNGMHALLDAYKGGLLHTFTGHLNEQGLPLEACFTPDAGFVISGAEDGSLWRWQTSTGQASPILREHHAPLRSIKCNPTRMMLATACSQLSLWLPP
jgi:COMPASS component SWD2